jgi:prolipoprotein diacylglyceryl transferase
MKDAIVHWDPDPVFFWLTHNFSIKYYGVLFMIGLLLGYLIVKRMYIRENLRLDYLDMLLLYIAVGMLVGARLGHCLFYEPLYYFGHPLEILFPFIKLGGSYHFIGFQGLSSHGGTIGVFMTVYLFSKRYKVNFMWLLDKLVIAIPVTATFIRLGNFMNSENYGKATNGHWGVIFERNDMIPRHPTQLYEALAYFLIFVFLYILYNRPQKRPNGIYFGIFLTLLFSLRFIIEFFKVNQVEFENGMILNMGQILSIPIILFGLTVIMRSVRKTLSN